MTGARAGHILQHIRRLAGARRGSGPADAQLLERFAARREESAFADLVRRHGPMVLGVCRSVLRHEQDAEDAFQATFLVLARKADSIRQPGAVAGYLYEVAYRVAVKARDAAARRRDRERRASPMADADPTLDMTLRDLRRVLHEELRRLPDKYRLPLVLCYLEGRSHEEAAGQLGLSKGTFRGRLDRGREHLRRRLLARGVALSALLCATAVAPTRAAGPLVESAVRAAAGAPSARASALADGVSRALGAGKCKFATAVLLAVGLVAAGAGVLAHQASAPRERPAESPKPEVGRQGVRREAAKPQAAEDKDTIAYGGRVLGPDGRPVATARLYMTLAYGGGSWPALAPQCATSGSDGRFTFRASRAKFGERWTVVAATAAGHGAGWVEVPAGGKRDGLTIKLVRDDVPITGEIVDLEGRPVAGATLTLLEINAIPGEDLAPWLKAARGKKGLNLDLQKQYLTRYTVAVPGKVTTDAKGRFRLTGIGRDRVARLRLDGPTIASEQLHVRTRPGKTIIVTESEGNPEYGDPRRVVTYYGANFRHAAAPTRPIVGVVRDRDTGKPLTGVTVRSYSRRIGPSRFRVLDTVVRTTTDVRGRYRLVGMPRGEGYNVVAIPGRDQPYVVTSRDVPHGPGLDRVTADFRLRRGVWIEGKITDKVTGKPLRAGVEYFSLSGNPNLSDYPGFDGTILLEEIGGRANEDGSYRVVGLPGPGLVVVWRNGGCLGARERDDEFRLPGPPLSTAPYQLLPLSNYGAFARIDPPRGAVSVKRDVTLDPGWTFTGTVRGPDGKPLAGVRSFGRTLGPSGEWDAPPLKTGTFTVQNFNPRRPRAVLFQHPGKGLVGVLRPPKANGGSVTVRMEPGAAVTGRLVDADGRPRAGVDLEMQFRPKKGRDWERYSPEGIRTDREGRFRIGALLPGYEYQLSDGKGERPLGGLSAGRTKDLGDVRIERAKE